MISFGGTHHLGAHAIVNHAVGVCSFLPSKPTPKWQHGSPRTDGKTIWLDCSNCRSPGEYTARCGDNVHELAHFEFQTVQWCNKEIDGRTLSQQFADEIGRPLLSGLAHQCINVIIDIADEFRIEANLPGVKGQIRIGNLLAARKTCQDCYGKDWRNALIFDQESGTVGNEPAWKKALLTLIGWYRLYRIDLASDYRNDHVGHWLTDWDDCRNKPENSFSGADLRKMRNDLCSLPQGKNVPDIEEMFRSAKRVALSEKDKKSWVREFGEWAIIRAEASNIFCLIAKCVTDEDAPEESDGKSDGSDGKSDESDPNKKNKAEAIAAAGENKEDCGCTMRGELEEDCDLTGMDEEVRNCVRSNFATIASELMESQEAMVDTSQVFEGDRMHSDWRQLFLGGAMFTSKQEAEGEELSLAVLIDRSSSQRKRWVHVKSATVGAIEAMRSADANVQAWAFASPTSWEKLTHDKLVSSSCGGGTNIYEALDDAERWLRFERGKKMVLIMTDGMITDLEQATPLILKIIRRGWGLVVVGLGMSEEDLRSTGWDSGIPCIGCSASQFPTMIADRMAKVMHA